MAQPHMPVEQYAKMLESFRQAPGRIDVAAKACGAHRNTCSKAWHNGLRNHPDPALRKPIIELVADEQTATRLQMQAQKEEIAHLVAQAEARRQAEQKKAAITDIAQSRAQELAMVRLGRGATTQLLSTVTNVAVGAAKVGSMVRTYLENMAAEVDPKTGKQKVLTPVEASNAMSLLQRMASTLRAAQEAADSCIKMERLLAGEPTHIIGVQQVDNMTMDEAEKRIAAAQRAFARARARGITIDVEPTPLALVPALPAKNN